MTTELEKQFFEAFDIQYEFCSDIFLNPCKFQCDDCEFRTEIYPQITDRQYLELILIYSQISNLMICYDTVERFKEVILKDFIENSEDYKHQVQAIFNSNQ